MFKKGSKRCCKSVNKFQSYPCISLSSSYNLDNYYFHPSPRFLQCPIRSVLDSTPPNSQPLAPPWPLHSPPKSVQTLRKSAGWAPPPAVLPVEHQMLLQKAETELCAVFFLKRITNRTELSDTVWHSVDGLEWWRKDVKASSWKFDKLGKLKNSKTHRTCEQLQNDIAATKQYFILLLVPDYHTNHLIHDSESLSILSMQWPFF